MLNFCQRNSEIKGGKFLNDVFSLKATEAKLRSHFCLGVSVEENTWICEENLKKGEHTEQIFYTNSPIF